MTIPPLDLNQVKRTTTAETTPKKEEQVSARNKRIEEIKDYDFNLLKEAVIERRNRSFTI